MPTTPHVSRGHADIEGMKGVKEIRSGGRRHWEYWCLVCEKYLGSSAPLEQHPSRESQGDCLCDKCREKIKNGEIPPPEKEKKR
jgi:hypothetical protein